MLVWFPAPSDAAQGSGQGLVVVVRSRRIAAAVLASVGLGLAALGFSLPASAGTSATVSVSFSILPTQTLTISTERVHFGDVSAGVSTPAREVVLTVKSNTDYYLSYTATDFTDGAGQTVPVSRLSPDGGRTSFGHTGMIAAGTAPTGGTLYSQSYVLTVAIEDPAGAYTGAITYSLEPR